MFYSLATNETSSEELDSIINNFLKVILTLSSELEDIHPLIHPEMLHQVHSAVKIQHPYIEKDVQDIPWLESWATLLVKPQSFHVAREMTIINSPSAGKETGTEKKARLVFSEMEMQC